MSLVVDASVALRWFVPASGSEAAARLLENEQPLIAPDLVVSEICNATRRLVRAGEISPEQGRLVVSATPSTFSRLIESSTLVARAFDLSLELDHPAYDCFYLALAEVHGTAVVTADQRLIQQLTGTSRATLVIPLEPS